MDVQRPTKKLNRSSKIHQRTQGCPKIHQETQQIFEGPPKKPTDVQGSTKNPRQNPAGPHKPSKNPPKPQPIFQEPNATPRRRRPEGRLSKTGSEKRKKTPPKKTKRRITIHWGPGGAGGDGEGGVRLVVVFCFRGGRGKVGTQPIHNARSEGEFKESEDWSLLLLR